TVPLTEGDSSWSEATGRGSLTSRVDIDFLCKAERFTIGAIAVLLLMTSLVAAQSVSQGELQFREALHKQQVEGDLNGAINLYQAIVSSKTADKVVRAKALLQLAMAYDTLGRQSESLYQQIVRDFPDQPAAVQAKAKLAALRPPAAPATMTMR